MKIIESKLKRVRPREFKEFATLELEAGDVVRSSKDSLIETLGYPRQVRARRRVLKNGTPKSSWLFSLGNYPYTLEKDKRSD